MRQLELHDLGGPDSIQLNESAPEPVPGPDEVLIDVHFVGPAFPDYLMSQGRYQFQPDLPWTPASDFSGVVRSDAADDSFVAGQRVAGYIYIGAAAEVIAAPTRLVYPVPDDLPLEQAAAMPLNYMTAHFALTRRGDLKTGETVLVHGAAGGVGYACLQVGRALGARMIGIVSTEEKAQIVRDAGAEVIVGRDDLPAQVSHLMDGEKADIVIDVVGGDVTDSLRSLRPAGRLLVVGFTSGTIPTVKVNRLLLNNLDVRGVEWGLALNLGITSDQWKELMDLRRIADLTPLISSIRPLELFGTALTDLSERRVLGRIVVSVQSP